MVYELLRIGEASHPGPRSGHSQKSIPQDVLDALQNDFCRDDSDSNVQGHGSPPSFATSFKRGHAFLGIRASVRRTRRRVRRVQDDGDSDL